MKTAFIASSLFAMSLSYAGVVKKPDGYYLEKECGFNSFKTGALAFKIKGEDKIYAAKQRRVDTSGCIAEEKLDFVSAKDVLIVRAMDINGQMQNIAQYAVPAVYTGGIKPLPTPEPNQPEPNKKTIDISLAMNLGAEQAKDFAEAIANTYGVVANFRYNFQIGFNTAYFISESSNYVQSRPEYQAEYQQGLVEGKATGARIGQSSASSRAMSSAKSAVEQVFRAAVDKDVLPATDLYIEVQPPRFNPGIEAPMEKEQRLSEIDRELKQELDRIVKGKLSYNGILLVEDYYWNDHWSLSNYIEDNYESKLLSSYFRGENAFVLWRDRKLGTLEGYNKYKEYTDSTKYSNVSEALDAFKAAFISTYNTNINREWNQVVRQINSAANAYGVDVGARAYRNYAGELGYYDGYRSVFFATAVDEFNANYAAFYQSNFAKLYEAQGEKADVRAIDGTLVFVPVPGSVVKLKLTTGFNMGGQEASLRVSTVRGPINANKMFKQVTLAGLTSVSAADIDEIIIGKLSSNLNAKKSETISVNIGGKTISANVSVDFKRAVQTYASAVVDGDRNTANMLSTFITNEVRKEWDAAKGIGNDPYGKGESLLERMMQASNVLSSTEKQALRSLAQSLKKNVLGKRPTWNFLAKDEWDKAASYLDRI